MFNLVAYIADTKPIRQRHLRYLARAAYVHPCFLRFCTIPDICTRRAIRFLFITWIALNALSIQMIPSLSGKCTRGLRLQILWHGTHCLYAYLRGRRYCRFSVGSAGLAIRAAKCLMTCNNAILQGLALCNLPLDTLLPRLSYLGFPRIRFLAAPFFQRRSSSA